jgi:hypothetical protein
MVSLRSRPLTTAKDDPSGKAVKLAKTVVLKRPKS